LRGADAGLLPFTRRRLFRAVRPGAVLEEARQLSEAPMPDDVGVVAGAVVAMLAFAGLVYALVEERRRRR